MTFTRGEVKIDRQFEMAAWLLRRHTEIESWRLLMDRKKNAARNVGTSIAGQLLNNLLRFVCRTVFVYTLGKEFLGISSLYTNILSLLSISELGFASAVTFSLYKPLAENNQPLICAYMNFYKKAYRVIGIVIFLAGLCLLPFLPNLMTGVTDKVNIYEYYLLYLIQTVVSYLFFAYKATLLDADQKKYISDIVTYICQILMNVVQIVILVVWRSFLAYTITSIFSNILINAVISMIVDRKYPYLRQKAPALEPKEKKNLFSRIYAMALYKVSNAVGSATDNLIISSFISVVMVGIYNNYYLVIQTIQTVLSEAFNAVTASLGNKYVLDSKEHNEYTFRCLNLLNNMLVAVCAVCFMVLFQPFIILWLGRDYLLDRTVLIIIVLNFATNYMQLTTNIYRQASGVFVQGKYRAVANAVLNLVISIVLVKQIGLAGVFLGSIVSRVLTITWYDPWLLYTKGFGKSPISFYLNYLICLGISAGCSFFMLWIPLGVPAVSWIGLVVRGVLSIAVTFGAYWLVYGRTEEYHYLTDLVQKTVKRKLKRGK